MITYLDLIAATLLCERGAASAATLTATLLALDESADWAGGVLAFAAEHTSLPPVDLARTCELAQLYLERERQHLTLRQLEDEGIPSESCTALLLALDEAPLATDVGQLLGRYVGLTPAQVRELQRRVDLRLRSHRTRTLERARAVDFTSVEQPLLDRPLLDARALRLTLLFRGEQTSWLMRSRAELAKAYDASDLFEADDCFEVFGLSPGTRLDGYVIRSPLGEGGMGRLYLANAPSGDFVAIKTLRTEFAEAEDHARFEREAEILSRIQHPAVLPLLDEGLSEDGVRYLVLPAVEGETLQEALLRTNRPTLSDAFAIANALLGALEAIHDAGVIHKDLKPENVMLRDRAGAGFLYVIDFGLSHLNGQEVGGPALFTTGTSDLFGTPSYLAPEQIYGDRLTPQVDLYAFGVILFRLLTGELPITGPSPYAVLNAQVEASPRTLAEAAPDRSWSPGLQRLLTRLLHKDPAKRPESASAVRGELLACTESMRVFRTSDLAPHPTLPRIDRVG